VIIFSTAWCRTVAASAWKNRCYPQFYIILTTPCSVDRSWNSPLHTDQVIEWVSLTANPLIELNHLPGIYTYVLYSRRIWQEETLVNRKRFTKTKTIKNSTYNYNLWLNLFIWQTFFHQIFWGLNSPNFTPILLYSMYMHTDRQTDRHTHTHTHTHMYKYTHKETQHINIQY